MTIMFGHVPEIGDIEHAVVGRSVLAHKAGTVEGERDGKVLEAEIVNHLVVRPLREGGIDGGHGVHAFDGKPAGKGDAVGLGNADVEETIRDTAPRTCPSPVPSDMAAEMATILSLSSASLIMVWPNTSV